MTRDQWLWMQASVALVAAAARTLRIAEAKAQRAAALPAPRIVEG